jgi:hypothetical protein
MMGAGHVSYAHTVRLHSWTERAPFWSWWKSDFREYLWATKLDSWDLMFVWNVKELELGIEVLSEPIFWHFTKQSKCIVNSQCWHDWIQGDLHCYHTDAYVRTSMTCMTWLCVHFYLVQRKQTAKEWEVMGTLRKIKNINKPFLWMDSFGELALFQDKAFLKIRPFSFKIVLSFTEQMNLEFSCRIIIGSCLMRLIL